MRNRNPLAHLIPCRVICSERLLAFLLLLITAHQTSVSRRAAASRLARASTRDDSTCGWIAMHPRMIPY